MVIENMTFQGNVIQASIGGALNPSSILGRAINRGSILEQGNKPKSYYGTAINPISIMSKAINRDSILEQSNIPKSYCGKAINQVYWSLPNNRLKLTAPSVHAFCFAAGAEDPGPRGEKACPSARSLSVALDRLFTVVPFSGCRACG
jgi:hypothetical protein